ncbi:30S ribosomal protein S11 [Methylobacterium haplocladii]|uniref:Small ribosomal subunit protein uS11c n=2 Tax=cellular organisms TaxID=131567 RepID=A0A286LRU1_9MAGN|nr:ribosomal protein S11 [Circaeaster agrestis]GLS61601.1 30S ribosomal protein S11 [Methylobacterium haplocladii]GLT24785.1 30S ribosomal protein S11 [Zoogloea oryzae]ASV47723.1 ribosomal protein S11 [Circaeaster agrestis]QKI32452.1 ribosomal protein S11 [Circaeaster agrestis]QKI32537.1 ribosomal protein S11 [Circaeaster agrestis]
MAQPISRIGLRRNRRFISRTNKNVRRIQKGVIFVQASFNNTIITVTDVRGRVVSWSSAGTCGFKGKRRGTPFAAQTAARNALVRVVDQGMQRAEVMIKGPGLGRDAALRTICRSGIRLSLIRDITPLPHNGCRPPKKRRV